MNFRELEQYEQGAKEALQQYWETAKERTVECSLLYLSENATFLVKDGETGNPLYTLRVSRKGYHKKEELEAEVAWLEILHSPDFFTESSHPEIVQPVRNRRGEYLTRISLPEKEIWFDCILFHFLQGCHPDPETEEREQTLRIFRETGRAAALLHCGTMNRKECLSLDRPHWDLPGMLGEQALFGNWRNCSGLTEKNRSCLETVCGKIAEYLDAYGKTEENYGLIHSDLRAANLLVDPEDPHQLKILDFDDCGFGWYLYDLAASLSFLETDPRMPEWIEAWLKGYEELRPLTEKDKMVIPALVMARRIQLTAWMDTHGDSDPVKGQYLSFMEGTLQLAENWLISDTKKAVPLSETTDNAGSAG